MISAWPGARPRTIPNGPTETTLESVERQCTSPWISRFPCVGTSARTVSDSPGPRTSRVWERTKSGWETSTGSVAISRLLVETWTTVRPGPRPVTTPAVSTDAISDLSDFQVTRPAAVGVPSSRTATGVIRTFSPGNSVTEAGSRVRREAEAARAPIESPGALPVIRTAIEARLPWARASILARPGVIPRTVPSFLTRAIIVSELQKTNLVEAMRFPRPSNAAAKRACF